MEKKKTYGKRRQERKLDKTSQQQPKIVEIEEKKEIGEAVTQFLIQTTPPSSTPTVHKHAELKIESRYSLTVNTSSYIILTLTNGLLEISENYLPSLCLLFLFVTFNFI